MIYNFSQFILESLNFDKGNKEQEYHYRDRQRERLAELRLYQLIDSNGNKIKLKESQHKLITKFFQRAYSYIADPKGALFNDTDIDNNKFGVVHLGTPSVILEDGTITTPEFIVPLGKDDKSVIGSHFYIQTSGKQPITILVQKISPNVKGNTSELKRIAFRHISKKRKDDLESKHIHLDDEVDVNNIVEVNSNQHPVTLDLSSDMLVNDQLGNILERSTVPDKITISTASQMANYTPPKQLPVISKQMNIIPDAMWLLDYVESKQLWTAFQIKEAKLLKLPNNHIQLRLAKRVLYYFDKQPQVPYKPGMNTIDSGQNINIAKRLSNGTWIRISGTVKKLSIDLREGNVNPYIMTDDRGWTVTEIDPTQNDIEGIFSVTESILNYSEWNRLI